MARRTKQRDIEEAIDEQKEAERRRNSELTDDEKRALTFQWKRDYSAALDAKKTADAKFKNVCKQAKAELGPQAVNDIKALLLMETPEGEASVKAAIEQQIRVARWAASPIGTQFQFFETGGPAVDQAFENGKKAGFDGKDMSPPHDPSVPQYQRWIEGWHAAQEVLMSGFRDKLKEDVPAERTHVDVSNPPFRPADDPALNPQEPATIN